MNFERKIDLNKIDATEYIKKLFEEENRREYKDGGILDCKMKNNGKIKIFCKWNDKTIKVKNTFESIRFEGKVEEIDERHSVLRLGFVDNIEKNRRFINYLFLPLLLIIMIVFWYFMFFANELYFLFGVFTVVGVAFLAWIVYIVKVSSEDEKNAIEDFCKAVEQLVI